MPSSETNMVQRMQFVMEWKKSEATMTSSCRALPVRSVNELSGWTGGPTRQT